MLVQAAGMEFRQAYESGSTFPFTAFPVKRMQEQEGNNIDKGDGHEADTDYHSALVASAASPFKRLRARCEWAVGLQVLEERSDGNA
jgi:hypothetical protein